MAATTDGLECTQQKSQPACEAFSQGEMHEGGGCFRSLLRPAFRFPTKSALHHCQTFATPLPARPDDSLPCPG